MGREYPRKKDARGAVQRRARPFFARILNSLRFAVHLQANECLALYIKRHLKETIPAIQDDDPFVEPIRFRLGAKEIPINERFSIYDQARILSVIFVQLLPHSGVGEKLIGMGL